MAVSCKFNNVFEVKCVFNALIVIVLLDIIILDIANIKFLKLKNVLVICANLVIDVD